MIAAMKKFATIALPALFLLPSCASLGGIPSACEFDAASGTLSVSGEIEDEFGACIAQHAPVVDTLVVHTGGGDVEIAMDAADALEAGGGYDLVVDGLCASSCANYLLPAARRVVVREGGAVMLHGSLDQGLKDSMLPDDPTPAQLSSVQEIMDRQEVFRAQHDIHPGWWLRRKAADYEANGFGQYVSGEGRTWGGTAPKRISGLAATPAFIASCLSELNITFEQPEPSDALRKKLDKHRWLDTSDMTCVDPAPPG